MKQQVKMSSIEIKHPNYSAILHEASDAESLYIAKKEDEKELRNR